MKKPTTLCWVQWPRQAWRFQARYPRPKWCRTFGYSSPYPGSHKIYWGISLEDDKALYGFFFPGLKQLPRTSPWSAWPPSQRFIKFSSYLEPRVSSWPTYLVSPYLTHLTPHCLHHRVGRASIYETEEYSALVSICRLSTYQSMRLDHLWASPSSKEWPVGWMQPELFFCVIISLIISIGQGVLTRWQKFDTSKARLDGTDLWRLPGTIRPDIYTRLEWFWNNWKLGRAELSWVPDKDSTGLDCLEPTQQGWTAFENQIRAWTALKPYIPRTYRHERMTRDEEDDDVWALKDDE